MAAAASAVAPWRSSTATDEQEQHNACVELTGTPVVQERETLTAAFWVALCLNQPAYQEYLMRLSGAAFLPRVRLSALRELILPTPPLEAEPLAAHMWQWSEDLVANAKDLHGLIAEVEDHLAA